jgi:hypothetical protein
MRRGSRQTTESEASTETTVGRLGGGRALDLIAVTKNIDHHGCNRCNRTLLRCGYRQLPDSMDCSRSNLSNRNLYKGCATIEKKLVSPSTKKIFFYPSIPVFSRLQRLLRLSALESISSSVTARH